MNNDLISRSALLNQIDTTDWSDVRLLVEDAPTVELDESIIQEVLNKRCMTAVANEYLIELHGKRPKGDYISREVINSEIEKRYCSKHCVVPSEEPYCPDNCPARFLKNIVKECPSVPQVTVFTENADEKAIEDMKAELQNVLDSERQKGKWISVKNKLPEEKINPNTEDLEEVLCSTIWGDVRAYKFGKPIHFDKPHFWYACRIMDKYVTHWQYLPEPYKKGGAE